MSAAVCGQPLSSTNREISHLRRLLRRRRARLESSQFVIEGVTLLDEALSADVVPEAVYVDSGDTDMLGSVTIEEAVGRGSRLVPVAPGVIARVADVVTPRPVLAVARRRTLCLDEFTAGLEHGDDILVDVGASSVGPVVVLVGIADPGNAGTIMRSAEAFGASGIVFCEESVDAFAPKTVRSSAGSVFHIPVVEAGDAVDTLDALKAAHFTTVGTAVRGGTAIEQVDLSGQIAVVVGNEAHGLDPALAERLDRLVTIPMVGRAESLNVAMATTLVCFEALRQRRSLAAHDHRTGDQ